MNIAKWEQLQINSNERKIMVLSSRWRDMPVCQTQVIVVRGFLFYTLFIICSNCVHFIDVNTLENTYVLLINAQMLSQMLLLKFS